ncbi:hypothetical protein AGIG_G16411 [Arapaima gigas]
MSGRYPRRCFKCGRRTRNIKKHLYYVHRLVPLDKRPDCRETPSHGAESSQSQPCELPEAAGGKEVKEEQQLRKELLCLETLWVEIEMMQRKVSHIRCCLQSFYSKWKVQAAIRQSKAAVELDMLRNLVVQPVTEYTYAGPSVPGIPRIVSYFGPFQESVVQNLRSPTAVRSGTEINVSRFSGKLPCPKEECGNKFFARLDMHLEAVHNLMRAGEES